MKAKNERWVFMGVFLLLMALCLTLPVIASAGQAPVVVTTPQITTDVINRTATLTWTAPTLYTDGTPITETISYNVFEGPCSLATLPRVLGPITAMGAVRTAQPSGDMCYQVSAQTSGGESARSARGAKNFPFPRPNTPPTLTVE